MPSDFLTEHRQRFCEFNSQLNREQYLFHSGQKETPETKYLYSEFNDLFSAITITTLQKELAATSPARETDQAAIKLLLANAKHEKLQAQIRDLDEEIKDYEAHATIIYEGERLSFHTTSAKVKHEPDPKKRHDLSARRAEIIKGGQDLRAERLEKLHAAAGNSGSENYLALYQESRGIDYTKLAGQMQQFLSFTESKYVAVFSAHLLQTAHIALDEATQADLAYLQQLKKFAPHFPAWQLLPVYRETFSGLGISTYKQTNIVLDDQSRVQKNVKSAHFPLLVPDEIQIVFTPADGQRKFQALLHEAGHAQQFAWTSRHLFPEFQFTGDGATREAFALLFEALVDDERWLADTLHFHESRDFRHAQAVQKLMRVRRYAAKLNYEVELHAGKLATTAGARYAELLTDAVRVKYDDTEHLRDVSEAFYAADFLRACAFEAQLREQLKTKYGSRWWTARKAGETLIDLWNTGGRYKTEELVKMIDLGELSFDWLAEDLLTGIGEK